MPYNVAACGRCGQVAAGGLSGSPRSLAAVPTGKSGPTKNIGPFGSSFYPRRRWRRPGPDFPQLPNQSAGRPPEPGRVVRISCQCHWQSRCQTETRSHNLKPGGAAVPQLQVEPRHTQPEAGMRAGVQSESPPLTGSPLRLPSDSGPLGSAVAMLPRCCSRSPSRA